LALRLKSHWHNEDGGRSMEEIGAAIAFNAWRIALDKAINLHGENFVYETDRQRLDVIAEYLIFEAQLVDRLVHGALPDESRRELITALALRMAEHFADNARDLLGPGDYADAFIARFNERSVEYAEFNFTDEGPSYPFMRHLGFEIQQIMGTEHENRWVIDQVMDMDGPEVYKLVTRITRDLLE